MGSSKIPKAVLVVTGAWHIPEHYGKLIAELEKKGVRAICPCLPTNNNAIPPNKTILDDIALIREIASAETAKGTQLTILAHSYGGAVVTAAVGDLAYPINGDPAKGGVTDIVFVTSFLLKEGETLAAMCGGGLPPFVHAQEDGTVDVEDPRYYFYNDLSDDDAKECMDMLVAHQKAAHFTKLECGKAGEAWRVIPSSYLICEGDTALLPPYQEMIIGRLKEEGVEVRVFRCGGGHSAFLSMPEKIAEVLLEVMASH
ncbi:hypothetical protein VMCG_08078 [Cytospora schulzeri]|uniref:AB hydrolase-1 domain-containing protein n=1 Tax=Cytospora schulzeri TaxID=448051 RepID=A0A423VR97_9PEZI|nr:hypothetical protein VMCG_08078 [Valsa malicola]